MKPHFSDTTSQFQLTIRFLQILMEVGVFTAGGYKFLCRSRNAENMNSNGHSLILMMHLNKNVKRMQNMFSLLCRCDYYPQSEPGFEISGTTTGGFLTLCPHQILIFHVLYLILIFPPPPVHGRVNS